MFSNEILMHAVMESKEGITIADATSPDYPIIFVNPAFERLTGYSNEELINKNCRFLQDIDKEQRNISVVQKAIKNGEYCAVTLRNYRKDGSMFWNELSISPVYSQANLLTHFIGIQKDVTARILLEQRLIEERKRLVDTQETLEDLVLHDALTGIYSRKYFEDQLYVRWHQLADTQQSMAVMFIDVDYFKRFNDTYGHIEGDNALKKIASSLKESLRRIGEFVARFGGEEFIVLTGQITEEQAIALADTLCKNIRDLAIPNETSSHNFLTISCGVVHTKPTSIQKSEALLQQADIALYKAKERGRNQVVLYEP